MTQGPQQVFVTNCPSIEHTDLDVIFAWWTRNSQYNIGIRPNPGDVVLEIDVRKGGTVDSLGVLPRTWAAATAGGYPLSAAKNWRPINSN
ncbi:hypothetical protein ACFT1A_21405 [Rhodococcus sp. NPDC057135]|uniref:hypothetical protein n=1 Tax=Rhodococcus sp. NPDC057135 TaxID=3346028 RepID=UPI00363192F4